MLGVQGGFIQEFCGQVEILVVVSKMFPKYSETEFGGLKSLRVSGLEKWQYDSDEGHCQGLDLRLAS